jgi:hypothetical protein
MPEEYTFFLNKSYSRESRTNIPGKREWQNRRDPGKSGMGNPGNETLLLTFVNATPTSPDEYTRLLLRSWFIILSIIAAMRAILFAILLLVSAPDSFVEGQRYNYILNAHKVGLYSTRFLIDQVRLLLLNKFLYWTSAQHKGSKETSSVTARVWGLSKSEFY